jgi:hypothetical protein
LVFDEDGSQVVAAGTVWPGASTVAGVAMRQTLGLILFWRQCSSGHVHDMLLKRLHLLLDLVILDSHVGKLLVEGVCHWSQ